MQLHSFLLSSSKETFLWIQELVGYFIALSFLKLQWASKQEVCVTPHSQQISILLWILHRLPLGKEGLKVGFWYIENNVTDKKKESQKDGLNRKLNINYWSTRLPHFFFRIVYLGQKIFVDSNFKSATEPEMLIRTFYKSLSLKCTFILCIPQKNIFPAGHKNIFKWHCSLLVS